MINNWDLQADIVNAEDFINFIVKSLGFAIYNQAALNQVTGSQKNIDDINLMLEKMSV